MVPIQDSARVISRSRRRITLGVLGLATVIGLLAFVLGIWLLLVANGVLMFLLWWLGRPRGSTRGLGTFIVGYGVGWLLWFAIRPPLFR
jgi:hypothetical protein